MSKTPQALGYEFDYELASMIGGERHAGSGNRPHSRLDASGHTLIFSGKYVDAASFSIKEGDLDEMLRATVGPEAIRPSMIPILGTKYRSGRMIATLELRQLLDWISRPPELIPTSNQDNLRATARTPGYLRDK